MCDQKWGWEKGSPNRWEPMEALVALAASVRTAGFDFQDAAMSTKIKHRAEDDFP